MFKWKILAITDHKWQSYLHVFRDGKLMSTNKEIK